MPAGASDEHPVAGRAVYTHEQCSHGKCLNHSPQWERVGEPIFQNNPTRFRKIITFLRYGHCGIYMRRMSKSVLQRCKLCGRTEELLLEPLVAVCSCCGYHFRA